MNWHYDTNHDVGEVLANGFKGGLSITIVGYQNNSVVETLASIPVHADSKIYVGFFLFKLPNPDAVRSIIRLTRHKCREKCSALIEGVITVDRFKALTVKNFQCAVICRLSLNGGRSVTCKVG